MPVRIWGENKIKIGNNVFVGSNSWLEVRSEANEIPAISIGDNTSTTGYLTITAAEKVTIKENVMFARYVYISDHTHEFSNRSTPIMQQGIKGIAPVTIEEGAWLGQNVVVCPGVTIGKNAVIGANSVVKTNVPDYHVAVGAPARIIKQKG